MKTLWFSVTWVTLWVSVLSSGFAQESPAQVLELPKPVTVAKPKRQVAFPTKPPPKKSASLGLPIVPVQDQAQPPRVPAFPGFPTAENSRTNVNFPPQQRIVPMRSVPARTISGQQSDPGLAELALPTFGAPRPTTSTTNQAVPPQSDGQDELFTQEPLLRDEDMPTLNSQATPQPSASAVPEVVPTPAAEDDLLLDSDDDDDLLGEIIPRNRDVFSEQNQPPEPRSQASSALDALPPSLMVPTAPSTEQPTGSAPNGATNGKKALKAPKYSGHPEFYASYGMMAGPHTDTLATKVPYDPGAFMPAPISAIPADPFQEAMVYRGKRAVITQRPILELGRPLFPSGTFEPARNWFGQYNLVMPHFMVYGDVRTGVGINQQAGDDAHVWASRANLDMDLEITATERIHGFIAPLDRGGDFTRLDFTNSADFVDRTDLRLDTLFFEGDAGAIWGGLTNQDSPFDLPFTFGFLPFFYQNGVWANDNAIGAAVAIPARHSRLLKWSNFDATLFWASDQITTDAFAGDNNAAEFFGTAWFIEAYDGYIEVNYAFVNDDVGQNRSYHNFSVAYSRRYLHRVSNSIRFITNMGQDLPSDQQTAQGHLLLIENALISTNPNTVVPYFNAFYGQGRTQSLARAGIAGGILNNVGINFETDGLTGYPTLDPTAVNTVGAAAGINLLGSNFEQQLILEFAALKANGARQFRNAPGDQYAVGMRYQKPLNNAWIFRTDHMFGFLRNSEDVQGSRVELRFKF